MHTHLYYHTGTHTHAYRANVLLHFGSKKEMVLIWERGVWDGRRRGDDLSAAQISTFVSFLYLLSTKTHAHTHTHARTLDLFVSSPAAKSPRRQERSSGWMFPIMGYVLRSPFRGQKVKHPISAHCRRSLLKPGIIKSYQRNQWTSVRTRFVDGCEVQASPIREKKKWRMEEELKSLHLCLSHTSFQRATLKPLISDTLLKYNISKVAVACDLAQWGFQKKWQENGAVHTS